MVCRCLDIANCRADISTLEIAMSLIKTTESSYKGISSKEKEILELGIGSYELDKNIREGMSVLIEKDIKHIKQQLESTRLVCRKEINFLKNTLENLIIEDENYHKSEGDLIE